MPAYGVLHAVHTVAVDIVLDERGGMYEMTERSYSYAWYVVSASDNNKDSELRYCGSVRRQGVQGHHEAVDRCWERNPSAIARHAVRLPSTYCLGSMRLSRPESTRSYRSILKYDIYCEL